MQNRLRFLEFFAGGGMARAGLGSNWECVFANDFDEMKAQVYRMNWGEGDLSCVDVATVLPMQVPTADLAWASFPCQDLSLAGDYKGLGNGKGVGTRSGAFWPFWNIIRSMLEVGREPEVIVLENVFGALTANQGRDFAAISSSLSKAGYRFGAMVIDARLFVPQSRQRVFWIAVSKRSPASAHFAKGKPNSVWHPPALVKAHSNLSASAKRQWVWWNVAAPPQRNTRFIDLIEDKPTGVKWHTAAETKYLLGLMSEANLAKVEAAKASGKRMVGGLYRRTRPDENGKKRQRAEVRFDDVSGCLRTPAGGSSRQTILLVEGKKVRSRLLSPREAARLMGLDDSYKLPAKYNDAYHVTGDGVVVPVVRHLAHHLIEPLLVPRVVAVAAE